MDVPLSKRVSFSRPLWPQLLILAGVFLISTVAFPEQANAQSGLLREVNPPEISIVEKNDKKLDELDKNFKTEQEKLEEKLETVEQVKKEAEIVIKQKEALVEQVTDMRSEIEVLKAKVAEKKRLEAERTVTVTKYAGDAAGNLYVPGNCTWYVKQKRPDIGNQWGNANSWYASAAAAGFKTGKMAKKNAIGVSFEGYFGHVVYVEKWLGNGRILISEMNVGGLYNTQTREADESEFVYIYEL